MSAKRKEITVFMKNTLNVLDRLDKYKMLNFCEELGIGEATARIKNFTGNEGFYIQNLCKYSLGFYSTFTYWKLAVLENIKWFM